MTRKRQLTWLIILSALTAVCQYVLQGSMALGANPAQFPQWFFVLDYILWGIRAFVECMVIVYVISSKGKTKFENALLIVFEIALIGLITITVGPAIRAVGLAQTITQSLTSAQHSVWSFLLASYTSVMMGSAAAAYRIQPNDHEEQSIDDLRRYSNDLLEENTTLRLNLNVTENAIAAWNLLSGTEKSRLIASVASENPDKSVLAKALDVSEGTVTRGYKSAG